MYKFIKTILILALFFLCSCQKNSELPKTIISEVDKSEMILVPAGEFIIGVGESEMEKLKEESSVDKYWFEAETPQQKIYLDAFYIDKYEVTNAQYRKFVEQTNHSPPSVPHTFDKGKLVYGFKPWEDERFNQPDAPVVGVTYYDAIEYAKWAGKRLPTEAEWEKAARGTEPNIYPWGNEWDSSKCNSREEGIWQVSKITEFTGDISPYGIFGMGGNVCEWVYDWYDNDYYKKIVARNPKGAKKGKARSVRGGCWNFSRVLSRCASRNGYPPESSCNYLGFRCVKNP